MHFTRDSRLLAVTGRFSEIRIAATELIAQVLSLRVTIMTLNTDDMCSLVANASWRSRTISISSEKEERARGALDQRGINTAAHLE